MISVLLATYNKARFLDLTLAAYVQQSYKDFEIVIVDDGSTDNTREIVGKYQSKLNIHYQPQEKKGISRARAATLEHAKGKYIIITDDDRIPCKDFVYEHKRVLDSGKKCVNIGKECLIASYFSQDVRYRFKDEFRLYNRYPELLDVEGKQLFTAEDILTDFDSVIDKYYLSDYTESSLLNMVRKYGEDLTGFYLAWSRAFGGNMSYNKELCTKPLEYDHNYVGYGVEDIDFSYQLFLQGFHFQFSPLAINYHQEHPRGKRENRDIFRNFQYFCEKYPNLEVQMMKMEWDDLISLEAANDFYRIMRDYKELLGVNILKTLDIK